MAGACGALSRKLPRFATKAKDGNILLVMHFEGKRLNQYFEGRRETLSREALVVTSPILKSDVRVGVAPMEVETGYTSLPAPGGHGDYQRYAQAQRKLQETEQQ